jgi:hypothetical protein
LLPFVIFLFMCFFIAALRVDEQSTEEYDVKGFTYLPCEYTFGRIFCSSLSCYSFCLLFLSRPRAQTSGLRRSMRSRYSHTYHVTCISLYTLFAG